MAMRWKQIRQRFFEEHHARDAVGALAVAEISLGSAGPYAKREAVPKARASRGDPGEIVVALNLHPDSLAATNAV